MYFTKDAVFLQRERKKYILSWYILFSVWQDLVLMVQKDGYPNERFELVTNFPRRKLTSLDFSTTLKSAGLFPQETVFVQERWHRRDKRREVNELCRRSREVSWEIPSFVKGLRTVPKKLTDTPENVEFCFTSIGLSTNIVTKILRTFTRSADYLSMLAKYRPPKVHCLDFRLPLPWAALEIMVIGPSNIFASVVFNSSDISIFGKHVAPSRTLSDDQLLFSAML